MSGAFLHPSRLAPLAPQDEEVRGAFILRGSWSLSSGRHGVPIAQARWGAPTSGRTRWLAPQDEDGGGIVRHLAHARLRRHLTEPVRAEMRSPHAFSRRDAADRQARVTHAYMAHAYMAHAYMAHTHLAHTCLAHTCLAHAYVVDCRCCVISGSERCTGATGAAARCSTCSAARCATGSSAAASASCARARRSPCAAHQS
jgi:hypothetical protein